MQAIAIQIWLGLSLNSPSNLGRSQSSRRSGPMLWDLDQQFPGNIGGSQSASECGFPPFRFWRKKLESGPTDRPTDRQPPCARIKGGEREAQTSSSRSRFPTTPFKVRSAHLVTKRRKQRYLKGKFRKTNSQDKSTTGEKKRVVVSGHATEELTFYLRH